MPSAPTNKRQTRVLQVTAAIVVLCVALVLVVVRSQTGTSNDPTRGTGFTRVGREGPVFTVSVPRAKAFDEAYLMKVAERLSSEEIKAGGSGQISAMIWPDDVPVPKVPPTTELDASMKTQMAGIFINPKLNIKHLIRFRGGETVAERDFGTVVHSPNGVDSDPWVPYAASLRARG